MSVSTKENTLALAGVDVEARLESELSPQEVQRRA